MKKHSRAADYGKVIALPVAMYLIFFILSRVTGRTVLFGVGSNLETIIISTIYAAIIAWGASYNMRSMRFDFSIGSVLQLGLVLGGNISIMLGHGSIGILLWTALFTTILGTIVGVIVVVSKLPPIIVSLAMTLIYEGISRHLFDGRGLQIISDVEKYTVLGQAPWVYIITALIFVGFIILNNCTKFGYQVNAMSNGAAVAAKMGINERKIRILCYTVSGLAVGLAGSLYRMATSGILLPEIGTETTLTLISALAPIFIGTYLAQYGELTFCILCASLANNCLIVGLANLPVPTYLQSIGSTVFMVVFLAISMNQSRIRLNRMFRERARKAALKLTNQT